MNPPFATPTNEPGYLHDRRQVRGASGPVAGFQIRHGAGRRRVKHERYAAKASRQKPEARVFGEARETLICCAAPRLFPGSGKRRDALS